MHRHPLVSVIEGTPIVTYPSPLEAAKNAALVENYKITVLLATPLSCGRIAQG